MISQSKTVKPNLCHSQQTSTHSQPPTLRANFSMVLLRLQTMVQKMSFSALPTRVEQPIGSWVRTALPMIPSTRPTVVMRNLTSSSVLRRRAPSRCNPGHLSIKLDVQCQAATTFSWLKCLSLDMHPPSNLISAVCSQQTVEQAPLRFLPCRLALTTTTTLCSNFS